MNNLDDIDQSAIDVRGAEETESRIDAYDSGEIKDICICK
jgi:hypothetical protein